MYLLLPKEDIFIRSKYKACKLMVKIPSPKTKHVTQYYNVTPSRWHGIDYLLRYRKFRLYAVSHDVHRT